jgi:hypothetical protein
MHQQLKADWNGYDPDAAKKSPHSGSMLAVNVFSIPLNVSKVMRGVQEIKVWKH